MLLPFFLSTSNPLKSAIFDGSGGFDQNTDKLYNLSYVWPIRKRSAIVLCVFRFLSRVKILISSAGILIYVNPSSEE